MKRVILTVVFILGHFGYTYSNSSFLFSLRNKDNVAPFVSNIKPDRRTTAIYVFRDYGPWFGCNDILIFSESNKKSSYSNFGKAYQLPAGYSENLENAWNLLAGAERFLTSEIEVFY